MKPKIKALTGKTVRLSWGTNGNPHNAVGIIKKLWKVQFDFLMNDEMKMKIRYKVVTDVKLIKIK